MTESDLNKDRLQSVRAAKRPWGTPQIIVSEVVSRFATPLPTSTPFHDSHGPGTTLNGS